MNAISGEFNQSLFNISDPGKSYLSPANQDNLKKLTTGIIEKNKLFLITGERNCGKTTLIQRAISELEEKTLLVNINHESLNYEELINYTGDSLSEDFSLETSLEIKQVHLKQLIKTKSIKHIVFLISLSLKFQPATLEDILKFANSNLFSSCLSHLIVTGLPELQTKLKESNLLVSDIGVNNSFQIEPLSENDIRAYINFYLSNLNKQSDDLFSNAAVERIIFYSKGLPGLINRLCNLGLLTASIEEKSIVTEDMMDEVLESSLFLGNEFDYDPSALTSSPPEKQKQKQELFVDNNSFKPDWAENVVPQASIEKDFVKQSDSSNQLQQNSEVKSLKRNRITFDISNKSIFISGVVLGMLFSVLLATSWYFLSQQDQSFSKTIITIADSIKQKIVKKLPRNSSSHEDQSTLSSTDNKDDSSLLNGNEVKVGKIDTKASFSGEPIDPLRESAATKLDTKIAFDEEIEKSIILVLLQQAEQQLIESTLNV